MAREIRDGERGGKAHVVVLGESMVRKELMG